MTFFFSRSLLFHCVNGTVWQNKIRIFIKINLNCWICFEWKHTVFITLVTEYTVFSWQILKCQIFVVIIKLSTHWLHFKSGGNVQIQNEMVDLLFFFPSFTVNSVVKFWFFTHGTACMCASEHIFCTVFNSFLPFNHQAIILQR